MIVCSLCTPSQLEATWLLLVLTEAKLINPAQKQKILDRLLHHSNEAICSQAAKGMDTGMQGQFRLYIGQDLVCLLNTVVICKLNSKPTECLCTALSMSSCFRERRIARVVSYLRKITVDGVIHTLLQVCQLDRSWLCDGSECIPAYGINWNRVTVEDIHQSTHCNLKVLPLLTVCFLFGWFFLLSFCSEGKLLHWNGDFIVHTQLFSWQH